MKRTSHIVYRTSYIIILLIGLLLSGCRDKVVEPSVAPTPQPRAEAERTVIIYMAGDNSLSDAIREDTTEMAKGKALIPEDVNYLIYLDDLGHKPAIYELSAKNGIQLWKQYEEELCSTNAEVMLEALSLIEQYFPARHYGITFWSHATGWASERKTSRSKTFGQDTNHGATAKESEMEIPILRKVLAELPKFDYIFFDACFMQCIEVAYELRDVTDYMIGSPAEIPGPGAPYNKIIEALCKSDVQGIVRGYDSDYPSWHDNFYYSGVLLSCIDCTKLEALAEETGRLLTPFYMGRTQKDPYEYNFQFFCDYFLWDKTSKYPLYFDMRTTMYRLLPAEDYAVWKETFKEAVPLQTLSSTKRWYANFCSSANSEVQDTNCYGGVSMHVPLNIYDGWGWNENFQQTSWYKAAGWEKTGW